jgi:hypothetical protein
MRFSESIETPGFSCMKSRLTLNSYTILYRTLWYCLLRNFLRDSPGTAIWISLRQKSQPQANNKPTTSQQQQRHTCTQRSTMEHLKSLLSASPAIRTGSSTPTERSRRLHATLSSVARSIKSNFVDTITRKANKRASSPSPLSCVPPSSKRRRSMVMTPDTAMMSPSSTISSLTQSTRGDTNQAIRDVLYGVNDSGIEVPSTPSLSTGNLGLRRLLIPDVLQLQEEDSIVLVLSQTSYLLPLYKGSILQDIRQKNPSLLSPSRLQLANSTLQQQHEIKRLGQSHFEFRAVVMLYPKRHLLFDDAIDAATLRLWVGQGEGFTVELLDYPGQTILVKWKDLQDVNALEIWRLATRKDALPPISFGHPRSMEAKCDDLNDALGAVSGDLTQTLNILLEYYKTESRMYRRRASDLIANSTKTTKLQADTYLDELQIEIQSSALDAFVTEVDDLYKMAILQHFNSFHYVNEPLLPSSTKNQLYHTLSKRFPMHCSVLDSICTTERNLRANNPNTLQKKQHSVLFHFLTLCRL